MTRRPLAARSTGSRRRRDRCRRGPGGTDVETAIWDPDSYCGGYTLNLGLEVTGRPLLARVSHIASRSVDGSLLISAMTLEQCGPAVDAGEPTGLDLEELEEPILFHQIRGTGRQSSTR